jgi:hypothetical protein
MVSIIICFNILKDEVLNSSPAQVFSSLVQSSSSGSSSNIVVVVVG